MKAYFCLSSPFTFVAHIPTISRFSRSRKEVGNLNYKILGDFFLEGAKMEISVYLIGKRFFQPERVWMFWFWEYLQKIEVLFS